MKTTLVSEGSSTHQHSGSEVKLLEELGDKEMALYCLQMVGFLCLSQDVYEPFPLFLTASHPYKVQLEQEHLLGQLH